MYKILLLLLFNFISISNATGLHIPGKTIHKKNYKTISSIIATPNDVSDESWYPKNIMEPTPETVKEHDDILNMIRTMGYKINESNGIINVSFPIRYLDKHGLPDSGGFMRGMSLSNEIIERHFFIYPMDQTLHVSLSSTKVGVLLSYDLTRSEWEKDKGFVGLDLDNIRHDDGLMKKIKVSPLIKNIRP